MKLIYDVQDRPKMGQVIIFALQQVLAIMSATILVPWLVNMTSAQQVADGIGSASTLTPAAALFGAGVGTIIYLLFTKFKSPVFLGSSFAFLPSMYAAFAGAVSMQLGYLGIIIGATFAGLVYVVISIIIKIAGVNWINKIMPAVVIGPVVACIGLGLSGNAVGHAKTGNNVYVALICALVTFFVIILCSTYGKKTMKLIPFVLGILAGYIVGVIFTLIGKATGNDALLVIDFAPFIELVSEGINATTFVSNPGFVFVEAFNGLDALKENPAYIAEIAIAYVPVGMVVFAEHLADHKNLSSIIGKDLLVEPGLSRTLLGDGVGSIGGAFFGGAPNTTYGESIGCVAITGNASVITIFAASVICIIIAFVAPFVAFLNTIPSCVMGGVEIALYGFIAVSGFKMIQKVDLDDNVNLFTVAAIMICDLGGLSIVFGRVTLTNVAFALILGIIVRLVLSGKKKEENADK